MDNKKTGALISALRKEHKLSQRELAKKIGVTDKAVSKWETGRGAPDISVLLSLSKALDITVAELLNGEKAKKTELEGLTNRKIVDILHNNRKKIFISVLFTFFIVLAFFSIIPAGHFFTTVPIDNNLKIENACEKYFNSIYKNFPDNLKIVSSAKKDNYTAFLLESDGKMLTAIMTQDSLFKNRGFVCGGALANDSGISLYSFAENGKTVNVFFGNKINASQYTFTYNKIKYICPVESDNLINIFVDYTNTYTNPENFEEIFSEDAPDKD